MIIRVKSEYYFISITFGLIFAAALLATGIGKAEALPRCGVEHYASEPCRGPTEFDEVMNCHFMVTECTTRTESPWGYTVTLWEECTRVPCTPPPPPEPEPEPEPGPGPTCDPTTQSCPETIMRFSPDIGVVE